MRGIAMSMGCTWQQDPVPWGHFGSGLVGSSDSLCALDPGGRNCFQDYGVPLR